MRILRLAGVFLALAHSPACADPLPDAIRKSVVKIFTTYQKPNYYQPWQVLNQDALTGSGAVIEGNRILTNAHVVSDESYVQVRKAGEPQKYRARVQFVGHDCELAVLTVDDPEFFKDAKPLALGALPHQRDKVAAYGFPAGGDDLSITEGTVSRVEVTRYTHSDFDLLAVQTNAAINPGNSGGPVIKDGKMVGVSFQSYAGTGSLENTGYLVPAPIIRRFLKDIEDGEYDGVPALGMITQSLESGPLREFNNVPKEATGILVTKVIYGSSAWGALQRGDVVTAIEGISLSNDKTYLLDKQHRVDYTNIVKSHQAGDVVAVDVLRAGKPARLSVKLKTYQGLVEGPLYDKKPSYFLLGGLVFTPLTRNFINGWEAKDQITIFKYMQELDYPSPDRLQPVIIPFVLPHDVNEGYHDLRSVVVDKINGRKIARLSDVPEAFKHPLNQYHVIETDPVSDDGQKIVIDAAKAEKATKEVLARHGIAQDRSDDLRGLGSLGVGVPR